MFGGRGGKGSKMTVEDLYGISKKPKAASSNANAQKGGARARGQDQRDESEALASQILEAAHRLVERRRLELYLRECGLSLSNSQSECQPMLYR